MVFKCTLLHFLRISCHDFNPIVVKFYALSPSCSLLAQDDWQQAPPVVELQEAEPTGQQPLNLRLQVTRLQDLEPQARAK